MGYIEELRALVGKRPLILVAAGVFVLDDQNRVLLQRRADYGMWSAPGGIMELGETLEETARRELFEEVGLEAGALTLFSVASGLEDHYIYPNGDECYFVTACFATREVSGQPSADGVEGLEVRYFPIDHLPEPSELGGINQTRLPMLRDKILRGEI